MTVDYATANGTASRPGDYTASAGTLDLRRRRDHEDRHRAVNGDLLDEPTRPSSLDLTARPTRRSPTARASARSPTTTPRRRFDQRRHRDRGQRGHDDATFTVTLSAASGQRSRSTTRRPTARRRAGQDYYGDEWRRSTFAAGQTTKTVTVTVARRHHRRARRDVLRQPLERVNATIADARALGTITDDDAAAGMSIDDVDRHRGQRRDDQRRSFTVTCAGQRADRHGRLRDGRRHRDRAGRLHRGQRHADVSRRGRRRDVTVPVDGDTLDEANETFTVRPLERAQRRRSPTTPASARSPTTTPPPALVDRRRDRAEGDAGTTTPPSRSPCARQRPDRDGRLRHRRRHRRPPRPTTPRPPATLTFAAGQTTQQTFTVPVVGDLLDEANETFFVNLSSPGNATIADGQGIGTITDDDAAPDAGDRRRDRGRGRHRHGDATFTVTPRRRQRPARHGRLRHRRRHGHRARPTTPRRAGTLTFAAGETTQPVTVDGQRRRARRGRTRRSSSTSRTPGNATIADGRASARSPTTTRAVDRRSTT